MQLIFEKNRFITTFNEIKRYFRNYETEVSQQRIKDFYKFAKILNDVGYEVAFDFVGSLNFGQAEEYSDVDFILYIGCDDHIDTDCDIYNCRNFTYVKYLILETLIKEYVKKPYKTQVVDCINLIRLEKELNKRTNVDLNLIFRFAFYRSICRGVNLKILKPYHNQLLNRKDLIKTVEPFVDDVFYFFLQTNSQNLSFEKYRVRLNQFGIRLPPSILEKIKSYLYAFQNFSV
ncbi:MAG: hypothetical protein ACK4UJ_02480 [Leptonema sp. (in: bacteria)]